MPIFEHVWVGYETTRQNPFLKRVSIQGQVFIVYTIQQISHLDLDRSNWANPDTKIFTESLQGPMTFWISARSKCMLLTDKFWCRERGGWKCPTKASKKERLQSKARKFQAKEKKTYKAVGIVDVITSGAWCQLMLEKCHHRYTVIKQYTDLALRPPVEKALKNNDSCSINTLGEKFNCPRCPLLSHYESSWTNCHSSCNVYCKNRIIFLLWVTIVTHIQ